MKTTYLLAARYDRVPGAFWGLPALLVLAPTIVALCCAFSAPARAANRPDPMQQVKTTVDQVLQILQDPALKSDPSQRRQKLKDSVAGYFDWTDMAKSSLGYHWRDLSDQQRKDFVDLFTRFIEASYLSKIESYNGQTIEYLRQSIDGQYAQVNTDVIQQGKDPIPLNYRLKADDGNWQVYDVTVDNISITANYRNQFNRVINNRGFDALMNDMRAKQESLDQSIAK